MPLSLEELVDLAEQHARVVLVELQQGLRPAFLVVTPSTVEVFGIEADFDDHRMKEAVSRSMRALMREKGAVAYSFVSEAWMAIRKVGDPEPENVRDLPDKVEIVQIVAHDDKGAGMSRMLRIVRDDAGKVTDLVDRKQGRDGVTGRFSDLLVARA